MAAILATAGFAQAASIEYIGTQFNIEDDANTPTSGWRNATPAKPLDIDGDHVLGTDGWFLKVTSSNPSYATATKVAPNANASNWGLWDNPADPSGADTITAWAMHDASVGIGDTTAPLIQFVITDAIPAGETLRVGVLFDVVGGTGTAQYILEQTVGGTATATTPDQDYDAASLDVAFFDITGFSIGDTFVIKAHTVSATGYGAGFEQVAGITFDTGVIGTPGPTDPKISSFSVSGDTATITMTGDDSVDYWCTSSTDLTGWSTEETALETGTATPIPSPFNTSGGTLTFDVDVTGDSKLFLRIQDADPNP